MQERLGLVDIELFQHCLPVLDVHRHIGLLLAVDLALDDALQREELGCCLFLEHLLHVLRHQSYRG
jgi:hypothetical protein